jgi:hypothetical protein
LEKDKGAREGSFFCPFNPIRKPHQKMSMSISTPAIVPGIEGYYYACAKLMKADDRKRISTVDKA